MKYVRIIAACDMTKAQTGQVVEAAETVYIAFGSDPKNLQVRELDLDEEWSKELHEFLLPFLNASHEPGELVTPVSGNGDGGGNTDNKREYKKNLVAWAKAKGYNLTTLVRGGHYAPVKTRKAYALHLAGRDDELIEANGMQPDYDPATGNAA